MKGGFFSVLFGFIMWKVTGNIWVGAIIAVVFTPILEALIQVIIRSVSTIGVKTPPFAVLKELDASVSPEEKGKGMRVLIVTDADSLKEDTIPGKDLYETIYADSIAMLYKKEAKFKSRYDAVLEQNLPIRVCASTCKNGHMGIMTKCFSAWRKILADEPFLFNDDNGMFIEDIESTDPVTGEKKKGGIVVCFNKGLVGDVAPATDTVVEENAEELPAFCLALDSKPFLLQNI